MPTAKVVIKNMFGTRIVDSVVLKAINDNYSNVKNILIQHDPNTKNDKGYFASENENYSFEVINNTLVIKQDKTIVKYISGDNY